MYYDDKVSTLQDLFGTKDVRVERERLHVGSLTYPIIDDVIVLLESSRWPASLKRRTKSASSEATERSEEFAGDIQFTFGEEWQRYPRVLPEHESEFNLYFDLIDLSKLGSSRVFDVGCGIGRWSYFLTERCRELVLVDFSEAIFVARRNLAHAPNALFFMCDLKALPFRDGCADLLFSLGVLHHLPTNALDEVRALARLAPSLLIFLYYALDNRPQSWRLALAGVTRLRLAAASVKSSRARDVITEMALWQLYVPLIALGKALHPFGLERYVPLYDFYHDKSLSRIRQDVYDRFFTRIEQRYSRKDINGLRDRFREIIISDQLPYWHFLCRV